MNEITVATRIMTMTSWEISELVGSRHDNVYVSIERLAARGVISLPAPQEVKIQRERREEIVSVYTLSERDSYIVVAQLSPEFTAKLVDRWRELETRLKTAEVQSAKLDAMLAPPKYPSTATPFMTTAVYQELKALARKDEKLAFKRLVGRRTRSFLRNLLTEDSKEDESWENSPAHVDLAVSQIMFYMENAAELLEVEAKFKGKSLTPNLDGHTYAQPRLSTQVTPEQSLLK